MGELSEDCGIEAGQARSLPLGVIQRYHSHSWWITTSHADGTRSITLATMIGEDQMADDGFKLPGSSLEELEKVIDAYAQKQGPVTNEDLSKITGMNKADVSRNNGFLSSVELIKGGRYKSATELGKNLGRALHHQQPDEIRRYWHKTVTGNQFLSEQLTAVRVQKGVAEDVLPSKILYNAGASKNNRTKA